MTNRIHLAAAVSIAAATVLVAAPQASAEDTRPCVSNREWREIEHQLQFDTPRPVDRPRPRAVQRRWEVVGLGQPVEYSPAANGGFRAVAWGFPECGYSYLKEAWYGYSLDRKGRVKTLLGYVAVGATLHGHP